MTGLRFAVAAWMTGAATLLLADTHPLTVTLRDVFTCGVYAVIALSAVAFIAMMACCLYTDYRVMRHAGSR